MLRYQWMRKWLIGGIMLAVLAGCSGKPSVEMPDEPAPLPAQGPRTSTAPQATEPAP